MTPHFRKQFTRAVPRRHHRIAIVWAALIGAALLIAIPLGWTRHSSASDTTTAFAVADVGGKATHPAPAPASAAAQPAADSSSSPAATSSPAGTPSTARTTRAAKPKAPAAPAAKTLNFDFQLQVNGYYCGPAATRIAASTRISPPSQDAIAGELGTTYNGTNSAADVTRGLNELEGTHFYHATFIPGAATPAQMDLLQANVVHAISNGYGVVANIVGDAQDLAGGYHSYGGGHYISVIGYADSGRRVQIADPADMSGDGTYWMTTIALAQWMQSRGYAS